MDTTNYLYSGPNRILQRISADDPALLIPELEPVDLPLRFSLEKAGIPIEYIYFPETGVASVVANGTPKRHIEVGLFGREGLSGSSIILADDRSPHDTYMQVAGKGQRITCDALRRAIATSPTLHAFLLRYVQAFMIQTAQTALANGRARLEERLARWLLMCHDRIDGNDLPITHEFIAVMLGGHRPGVTLALQILEGQGLIISGRGRITINDRKGLEICANGSYGQPEAAYRRLIG